MATRVVEGKKPYTGGKAISIDENKVISLNLRDENNLIIYDAGDDEIYVDLQLDDEITPTSAFPIGVNVGRVIVDNGWDKPGTIISAETTSGDNIKIFYADEGTLWIDNGTGTFKQIYFKADVDALLLALRNYIDGELAKKQNGVSSDTAPSNPSEGDLWYDTTNSAMKVWDGTAWQSVGTGGGGSDIEYKTQAEYNALLPGALTDNKHYFIYSTSGGGGWQPGVNTVAYFPLNGDANDYSGNGYNGVAVDVTYTTLSSGKNVGTFNGSTSKIDVASSLVTGSPFTLNIWAYKNSNSFICAFSNESHDVGHGIYVDYYNGVSKFRFSTGGVNSSINVSGDNGVWYNRVFTYDGTTAIVYKDGTVANSRAFVDQVLGGNGTAIGYNSLVNGRNWLGYLSEIILEDKARTAQEIADYFDQTKGDYGIS